MPGRNFLRQWHAHEAGKQRLADFARQIHAGKTMIRKSALAAVMLTAAAPFVSWAGNPSVTSYVGVVALEAPFQDLRASINAGGAVIESTGEGGDARFSMTPTAMRAGACTKALSSGRVERKADGAALVRNGVTELFSTTTDGIRQDFLVAEQLPCRGDLELTLDVAGASVEPIAGSEDGVRVVMADGRELDYHKLFVTDATGRELLASIHAEGTRSARIRVASQDAVYPILIDPTFSDADWTVIAAPAATIGDMKAMAVDRNNSRIFFAGVFSAINGVSAEEIAVWNGSTFAAIPGGPANINALAYDHGANRLYVGGLFVNPGAFVASWSQADGWRPLGSGVGSTVNDIVVDEQRGRVYVTGLFQTAGGSGAQFIAMYENGAWSQVGGGLSSFGQSLALDPATGHLYASGGFDFAEGRTVNFVARWDGAAWNALGSGFNDRAFDLHWDAANNRLIAGGWFTTAGGQPANRIAFWQNNAWTTIPSGFNDRVAAVTATPDGGTIFVGGDFTASGSTPVSRIAVVQGGTISPIGAGANNTVEALAISPNGTSVLAMGTFTNIGGKAARIAALPLSAAPVLGNLGGAVTFTENGAAQPIVPTITVSDSDSTTLASAEIRINSGLQAQQDRLTAALSSGVTGNIAQSWDGATGTLTLTSAGAQATLAQWQAALRTITFQTLSEAPNPARTVSLSVSDGAARSVVSQKAVTVQAVNDAPAFSGALVVNGFRGDAIPVRGFALADVDASTAAVQFTISTAEGFLSASSSGGVTVSGTARDRVLRGSVEALNLFLVSGSLTFTAAPDRTGTVAFAASINDLGNTGSGGSLTTNGSGIINISGANRAPQFTGTPTIIGTARVGETLSIANREAVDPDGGLVSFAYQWLRNGQPIAGATEAAFVPRQSDVGATITARVTVSDGLLSTERLTNGVNIVATFIFAARDDRFTVQIGASNALLPILENDVVTSQFVSFGTIAISRTPTKGVASIDSGGTAGSPADDRIIYIPNPGARGADSFRYRICATGSAECVEAEVAIVLSPIASNGIYINARSDRGSIDAPLISGVQMGSARATPVAVAAAKANTFTINQDGFGESPWDGGREGTAHVVHQLDVLAVGAAPRTWRVVVDADSVSGGNVDLFVGRDTNSNGQPDQGELECTSAMSPARERCEIEIEQQPGQRPAYWVMAQNLGPGSQQVVTRAFEIRRGTADGLAMTLPGVVQRGAGYSARVVWNTPTMIEGDSSLWVVELEAAAGDPVGDVLVRVNREAGPVTPFALPNGEAYTIRLPSSGFHRGLFIDVPAGARSLALSATADGNVDLFAIRVDAPGESANLPVVPLSPDPADATFRATGFTGQETLLIPNPQAGRWYVIVQNRATSAQDIVVLADVDATAPTVRPGGYFNAQRPGTGIFLYPAGQELAGILYTYLEDSTPTWYYLQASAPGADGIWQAPIYRSTWDGTRNRLVKVGDASVTPSANNQFTFTYTIDGETGSERFVDFGGSCPMLGGTPVNVSGHWFDPAKAGTGYSVQLFANYEFYAVFGYDNAGVARYLSAELPRFGGQVASIDLLQVKGSCPLCDFASPNRVRVGTLTRTITNGRLSSIVLNAEYRDGVPGTWAANDAPIPLGGLQGCQ